MSLSLGKKPFVPDDRDVRFLEVLGAPLSSLPTPPRHFGLGMLYADWGVLGNDSVGDCVFAGAAHETMLWSQSAGHAVTFDDAAVLSDYSASTGYNPADPSTDQGADVRTTLLYRRDTGIVDASGVRHKIGAFVALTPGHYAELEQAAYIFLAVGVGVQFPDSAMDQFNNGQPWEVVPGANIVGGHYIVATGRRSPADNGVLTWGQRQSMAQAWYEAYCDEAWGLVSSEELRNGRNVRGLDLTALNAALQQIHG